MKKTLNTIALVSLCFICDAQVVNTITEGAFSDGLGIDSQGNIYGSDYGGDGVYKYNSTTNEVTIFDVGFANPNGIGVNPQDEVFICEAGDGNIHKYDTDGNVLEIFSGLNNPTGIKYDPNTQRMLWVSYNESSLYSLDTNTGQSQLIHIGSPLFGPSGIAFVGNDTFISNFNDRKIFKLESDNSLTELAQLPSIGAPSLDYLGFLSTKGGQLIATHIGGHRIFKVDPSIGTVTEIAGSDQGSADGPLENATFSRPNGILGDPLNDRIYVTDNFTRNLRIIEGITLGADEFNSNTITLNVFPNPSSDTLTVTGHIKRSNVVVELYEIGGKLLRSQNVVLTNGKLQKQFNIASLPKGMYLIEVSSGENTITKKFVK